MDGPRWIAGGIHVDARGTLRFVNDFDLSTTRRFYCVENHRPGFVRAWQGHRRESKAFTVLVGAALIGAVKIDDWRAPSPKLEVERFVLSEEKPGVLHVPGGYANGLVSLREGTVVLIFSEFTLDEARDDVVRFPPDTWAIRAAAEP